MVNVSEEKKVSARLPYRWFNFWSEAEKQAFKDEKLARVKPFVSPLVFEGTSPLYYGSKNWANHILVYCIEELNHVERNLSARRIEVFYFLRELEFYGWKWQADRLRNHINLAIKRGRFTLERSESDPINKGKGGLS